MKELHNFELACLKKMKESKEKHFGCLATFCFGTSTMLYHTTGCVVRHENTRRSMVLFFPLLIYAQPNLDLENTFSGFLDLFWC